VDTVIGVLGLVILDAQEYERWMKSAYKTLESARRDRENGFYNWAYFKTHLASEKALKALLWGIGRPRPGHALIHLLLHLEEELGAEAPATVKQACATLDKYHIPTRYPDAWVEGSPEDYFTESDADNALGKALVIVKWVEGLWRELSRKGG
jgi:HEPN domain-containing protein